MQQRRSTHPSITKNNTFPITKSIQYTGTTTKHSNQLRSRRPSQTIHTHSTPAYPSVVMRSTLVRLAAEATHSRTPMIQFLGKRSNLEHSQYSYLIQLIRGHQELTLLFPLVFRTPRTQPPPGCSSRHCRQLSIFPEQTPILLHLCLITIK